MIKYYCNRCNLDITEIEEKDRIVRILIGDEKVDPFTLQCITDNKNNIDLCASCKQDLINFITKKVPRDEKTTV